MRIKIYLRGSGILPYDYHRQLMGAMYRFKRIADDDLSTRLHYSHDIKLYTYSEIMIPKRKMRKEGIEILGDNAYLIYTSPHEEYVKAVVEGMLSNPEFRIGSINFLIERIEVLPKPDISWNDVVFKTLSPIVVSTRDENGKKVPLYPTDKEWYINVEKNIKHKYEMFHGIIPEGRVSIEVIRSKAKKYEFSKGNVGGAIKAVHGHFRFRGSPNLIEFAYEAGIGERGAQGFGCVEVANENAHARFK